MAALDKPEERSRGVAASARLRRRSSRLALSADAAANHGRSELKRVDYLDGWRGLAIAFVLVSHFAPKLEWIDSGRFGVDVFFCLSGLLMSNILFVRRVPLGVFYKRRASRIIPVFLLFVVVTYGVGWYATSTISWFEFISTALFLRTYIPASPGIWEVTLPIHHLWSLNVEEHCYLLLGLFASLSILKTREGWVLFCAGLASILVYIAYIKIPLLAPPWVALRTEVVAAHLLVSAGYCLIRRQYSLSAMPWVPVAAFLAAASCYTDLAPWWSPMLMSPFLLAIAVNHLSETPQVIRTILALPGIRLLGIWSYSIYLWQQPFYQARSHFFGGAGGALVAAMITGIASFYFFENPVRTWLNKNW